MNIWQKIVIGVLAMIAWAIALWVGYAYPTLAAPMAEVKMVAQGVLSGLGLYHLLITPPPSVTPPADNKQGGFANPLLLGLVTLVTLLLLVGCANQMQAEKTSGKMPIGKTSEKTQAKNNFWEDVGAVAEGAAIVGAVVLAPDEPTHTETRVCTTDLWGDEHCTVTVENQR